MADPISPLQLQQEQQQPRRSSSQTSSSSHRSQKAPAAGPNKGPARPKHAVKRLSAVSTVSSNTAASGTPADLTSFPSLSPDSSPSELRAQPEVDSSTSSQAAQHREEDVNSRAVKRGRQAALDRLTSSLSLGSGRPALFDDSFPTSEVPGALHLADNDHIEHLVERSGAVKLVRQFARDLAVRDAEISKLRRRADARERELKRMLRDVGVSSQDIERRLYEMENPSLVDGSPRDIENGAHKLRNKSSIGCLVGEAMRDAVGDFDSDDADLQATLRPLRNDSDTRSGTSSMEFGTQRRQGTVRVWQDYIFGTINASRRTSRSSSVLTDVDDIDEITGAPRLAANSTFNRRKGLDEALFKPPHRRGISPASANPANTADVSSVHSRKSSNSVSSWTVKLFAGKSQNKDSEPASASNGDRSRASSLGESKLKVGSRGPSNLSGKNGLSAVAALKRINSYNGVNGLPNTSNVQGPSRLGLQRRVTGSNVTQTTSSDRANGAAATTLGPVEMDAILPLDSQPPALSEYNLNYQSNDLLTDRFGFIYDQRRKKRQKEAVILKKIANRKSLTETINSHRSGDMTEEGDEDVSDETDLVPQRPESQIILVEEGGDQEVATTNATTARRWQDYLRIATRPTELLSHTPSSAPIVGVATASDTPKRVTSTVALDKAGAPSVNPNSQPIASTSSVIADTPEFANVAGISQPTFSASLSNEQEPVKILLEQLTELHDVLQRERTTRWNEFLRKVRAERRREGEAAAALDPERANIALNMPESTLADGEVVGIAGLGNKGKVGRNKWREFRSLVLGGIPVAHRPKIWAECSGASAMRVPGYYDDLVNMVNVVDVDPAIVAQIDMDIYRTLTDNVFFRNGPGVAKLRDVLLAYSRRNPGVGYCQGMNLIAGSLLLTTPTAEDAFWIMASMIENILPQHYYDHGLLASRADQQVLRQYITEVLPRLSAHLDELGVELEAVTFQWFLSIFTDCLSAEALYRVWDVVLCLNVTSTTTRERATSSAATNGARNNLQDDAAAASGGGSTFLFQVALALLKLNEHQLLTTCQTPAAVYTYVNHQMTNHAISIDGLIQASEALKNLVRKEDVVARRAAALRSMEHERLHYLGANILG